MNTDKTFRVLLGLAVAFVFAVGTRPARSAPEADTPYTRIAKLAGYISDGETVGALEAFDKNGKRYAVIAEDIQALAAQTEVLCSITVVEDKEAEDDASDIHHLDLDWFMTLKSRSDGGLVERRRERVAMTMERIAGKNGKSWRITSLSPETILAPITVK